MLNFGKPGREDNPSPKIPGQSTISRAEAEVGGGGGLTLAMGEAIFSPSPATGRSRRRSSSGDALLAGLRAMCHLPGTAQNSLSPAPKTSLAFPQPSGLFLQVSLPACLLLLPKTMSFRQHSSQLSCATSLGSCVP